SGATRCGVELLEPRREPSLRRLEARVELAHARKRCGRAIGFAERRPRTALHERGARAHRPGRRRITGAREDLLRVAGVRDCALVARAAIIRLRAVDEAPRALDA